MRISPGKIGGLLLIQGILVLYSCGGHKRNKTHPEISDEAITAGETLAKKYCQSCHLFPEPALLNTASWTKGVLPNMGPRLGIFRHKWERYPSAANDKTLPMGFYPAQPALTDNEWQNIIDYYTATSPDSLPGQERTTAIEIRKDLFTVSGPSNAGPAPNTCYIKVDTTTSPRSILQGDVFTKELVRFSSNLSPIDSVKGSSPTVDIDFKDRQMSLCNIGIINPNNGSFGKLQNVTMTEGGKMNVDSSFPVTGLQRPVQSIKADLNNDGLADYLVCEFGYLTGSLSWYENKGPHNFERHVLRAVPGAIKAYVNDYNRDGLPDIFVLFAQGDEGIILFTNKGHGRFEQKILLRFPPSYGSSYFEMDDFNHDGFPDILYTCGDNADFSPVLKPYHGIYIFLNDGHYNFKQQYFFPVNGCYKAMAADFDGDGDLDIAAIAFFADFTRQPEESFVYLENRGNFQFRPYSIPEAVKGRWLTMDVGNLGDGGEKAILLGNFSRAPADIQKKMNWKQGPPFLVLKKIKPVASKAR